MKKQDWERTKEIEFLQSYFPIDDQGNLLPNCDEFYQRCPKCPKGIEQSNHLSFHKEIEYNPLLRQCDKKLLTHIFHLTRNNYNFCWATNKELSKIFTCMDMRRSYKDIHTKSKGDIEQMISKFINFKYIYVEHTFIYNLKDLEGKELPIRLIRIDPAYIKKYQSVISLYEELQKEVRKIANDPAYTSKYRFIKTYTLEPTII